MALQVKDGNTTFQVTKVWDKKEKYTKCSFTTPGKKDFKTKEWINDFEGYVTFVGTAHKKVAAFEEGTNVKTKITTQNFQVSTFTTAKGNKVIQMTVFDFEFVDVPQTASADGSGFMNIPDGIEEDMPFN